MTHSTESTEQYLYYLVWLFLTIPVAVMNLWFLVMIFLAIRNFCTCNTCTVPQYSYFIAQIIMRVLKHIHMHYRCLLISRSRMLIRIMIIYWWVMQYFFNKTRIFKNLKFKKLSRDWPLLQKVRKQGIIFWPA